MLGHGGSLSLGVVVHRLRRQPEVLHVADGGGQLGEVATPQVPGHEQDDTSRRDEDDQVGGRQETPHTSGVEAPQANAASGVELTQEVGGNEKAGDDKEDVDPHEAALEPRGPQVDANDHEHRQRA